MSHARLQRKDRDEALSRTRAVPRLALLCASTRTHARTWGQADTNGSTSPRSYRALHRPRVRTCECDPSSVAGQSRAHHVSAVQGVNVVGGECALLPGTVHLNEYQGRASCAGSTCKVTEGHCRKARLQADQRCGGKSWPQQALPFHELCCQLGTTVSCQLGTPVSCQLGTPVSSQLGTPVSCLRAATRGTPSTFLALT